jgi:hypothetical protein
VRIPGQAVIIGALFALLALVVAASDAGARQNRCVVPNVKGAKLKTAETRLRAAHCAVGRVTGPRTAFVSAESPKAEQRKESGAKVALALKRKPALSKTISGAGRNPSHTPKTQPLGVPGTWHLVLDSEFNGRSLPPDWQTGWFGSGVTGPLTRNETDCDSPSNVTFPGDGTMHVVVSAQPMTCGGTTEPYTAALVTTNPNDGRSGPGFQYTYGVIEARVYLPGDNGSIANWPAFWANGQSWPTTGEDDVMEGLDGSACWSFHNSQGGLTNGCLRNIEPGWHTFASDWEPGSLTYYYDGVEVKSLTTGITSSPMYIILGNGVHANEAGVTEPDAMKVQYVRVWQH